MRAPDPIPLLIPDMPGAAALMPYLQRMDAARCYTNFGPLVQDLEQALRQRFADAGDAEVSLTTVGNATLGLELALQALALPPGSRVLVPALTFVATASAIIRAGHVPVVADIEIDSWQLSPRLAEQALQTVPCQAVLPVATFGVAQDMPGWQAFEARTGCKVVVDAASAWGNQWLQGVSGTLVFSLHTTKSLPAGEGGVLISSDTQLVRRVRRLSNFGIYTTPSANGPPAYSSLDGTNAKMSEYHAAVALASLARWPQAAQQRQQLYRDYQQDLEKAAPGQLGWQCGTPVAAPTLMCVRLPSASVRRRLEALCAEQNIMTRRWYQPLLNRQGFPVRVDARLATPHADQVADTLLGLPFYPGLTFEHRQRIAAVVQQALS